MPVYQRRRIPATVAVVVLVALFSAGCPGISNLAGTPIPLPYGGGPQIIAGLPFIVMGGTSDADLISIYQSSVAFPVPTSWTPASGPRVLTGDFVQMGVIRGGAMDTPGFVTQPVTFLPVGVNTPPANAIGFAVRQLATQPTEPDVMIPGCFCQGWATRFTSNALNYWGGVNNNITDGIGIFNSGAGTTSLVSFDTFSDGTNFATRSIVMVGPLRVTFVISLRKGDRYAIFNIMLTNTGSFDITNLRFDVSLDFDIDAAAGGSFSTDRWKVLQVGGVNAIVRGRGTVVNLKYYAVATRSPFMVIADGQTFYNTNPDSFANNDPNDAAGDFSSTFVFNVPTIAPGASVNL